ncbi:MAG: hypothetical protein AAF337_13510 [Pseudomonadota bacterium]
MKNLLLGTAVLAGLTVSLPAAAEMERRGPTLTLKVGSNGLGAEVTYGLSHIVRVRAGGYGFKAGFDATTTDVDYDLDLRLLSGAGYLDVHPFGGRFRLTAGLVYNANRADATGQVNQELVFGDNTFSPAQVGTIEGAVDFRRWSPYAGIGWGSPLTKESNWAFEADVGVLFQGRPEVSLMSVGGELSADPVLMNAVADEEAELQDDIDFFRFYPVVSLGVAYTF